jgi:hypothetical protein
MSGRTDSDLQALFQEGLQAHQAGRLADAEAGRPVPMLPRGWRGVGTTVALHIPPKRALVMQPELPLGP